MADPQPTTFRPAMVDDLEAIVAAYNAGIRDRVATFETEPRTTEDIAELARRRATNDRRRPQRTGSRVGTRRRLFRPLRLPGRGRTRRLRAPRGSRPGPRPPAPERALRGVRKARSVQTHQPRLHRQPPQPRRAPRRGFEEVGIQRRHGKLDGRWKDCVLVERLLGTPRPPTRARAARRVCAAPLCCASRQTTPRLLSLEGRSRSGCFRSLRQPCAPRAGCRRHPPASRRWSSARGSARPRLVPRRYRIVRRPAHSERTVGPRGRGQTSDRRRDLVPGLELAPRSGSAGR